MIVTSFKFLNISQLREFIPTLQKLPYWIEFRLDFLSHLDIPSFAALLRELKTPIIFTLRSIKQGGNFNLNQKLQLRLIKKLCALNPDYFDLEYDTPKEFIYEINNLFPQIKLICSYHNFVNTPQDLPAILASMQLREFHAYKIACMAQNTLDALRMLLFVKQNNRLNLTGICMGEDGQCTRILSPVIGNQFHYVAWDDETSTAPGQLNIQKLNTIYNFSKLNQATKIYALLGDPVAHSIGDVYHNKMNVQRNAVYIKLRISASILNSALSLLRQLPFVGFSVTMPLKEAILSLLDEVDEDVSNIQAVNTVVVKQDKFYCGYNTDGYGALQALKELYPYSIKNKRIYIIGAGGAARAIAYVLVGQGAKVCILNRTLAKAKLIAQRFGCEFGSLDVLKNLPETAIVINTLPPMVPAVKPRDFEAASMGPAVKPRDFEGVGPAVKPRDFGGMVPAIEARDFGGFNINYPSPFGDLMFKHQANLQAKLWNYGPEKNASTCASDTSSI